LTLSELLDQRIDIFPFTRAEIVKHPDSCILLEQSANNM
jgi:hypothetical protein